MADRPTMAKIAEELGLSRRTVSAVLNPRSKRPVADTTARQVRDYLRQRGYVPSLHARRLSKRGGNIIGLFHCGSLYTHLTESFNRLTDTLLSEDRDLEIVAARPGNRRQGLEELVARGVSRLVWIWDTGAPPSYEELGDLMPLLGQFDRVILHNYYPHPCGEAPFDRRLDETGIHRVVADRLSGAARLGELLTELGHRKVGLEYRKAGPITNPDGEYRARLLNYDLELFGCKRESPQETSPAERMRKSAEDVLSCIDQNGITTVWFRNDEFAAHAMQKILNAGVSIPDDLTVIGLTNISLAEVLRVPLTTVAIPGPEMTDCTLRLLQEDSSQLEHTFPTKLVLRQSHGPAP